MRKSLKVARWVVTWKPWGKEIRKEFLSNEKKARAFYKRLFRQAPEEQAIEELLAPLVLGRSRMISGVRFRSDGQGHWFTEDRKHAIFHMLRGTSWKQWELYRCGENDRGKWDDCLEFLEPGLALSDFKGILKRLKRLWEEKK